MKIVIPLWTLIGFGAIVSSILFTLPDLVVPVMFFSWILVTIFVLGYLWIENFSSKISLIISIIFIGGTILGDLILLVLSNELLIEMNRYFMIAAVPCFYLHGRYIGGLIAGIKFDGVSRDVFHFPTLKINYKTYLMAQPPKRQWIFFCGGIGTVVTSTIISVIQLVVWNDPLLFLFPLLLFAGEILDYLNLAGPLSGGEFSHLRRERRIIKDWKKKSVKH